MINLDPVKEATKIQGEASSPDVSVVLRASAGSGKTKVLVDRFLRLCIQDHGLPINPRAILAITFTKKAAVEIQKRLLKEARELALAQPDVLHRKLEKLLGKTDIRPIEKSNAAALYEILLEDLSALNVGTIHSFCQLILGRFAGDAGLDPHFSVLEDNTDLVDEALDLLEEKIESDAQLNIAANWLDKDPAGVRRQLQGGIKESMRLHRWLSAKTPDSSGDLILPAWNRAQVLPLLLQDLRRFLFPFLPADRDISVFDFLPIMLDSLENFLEVGLDQVNSDMGADLQKSMSNVTEKIRTKGLPLLGELKTMIVEFADPDPRGEGHFLRREQAHGLLKQVALLVLTQKNITLSFSRVKKEGMGEIYNAHMVENALGIIETHKFVNLLELYQWNEAFLTLLMSLLDITDDLKRRDRVIDFQDLEDMACRLMKDESRALSLMHRLDDNLNHILLDEFQDTNYNQWDMLKHIVAEFLATGPKTVFVVGDVKQSIYGFRAAEPELFSLVEEKMKTMGQEVRTLPTNFRSLPGVIDSVGCAFNHAPLAEFYSDEEKASAKQFCARTDSPGSTVVLPPYAPDSADETESAKSDNRQSASRQPENRKPDNRNADEMAADAAARLVRQLIDDQIPTLDEDDPQGGSRSLNWGDVLVLCRTRTEIGVYEKAFHQFNIPVMPAGRGMLAANREIQDVLALLRWLAYPADDIALATVLRSPIFRFSEEKFQKLLAKRDLHRPGEKQTYLPPYGLWATLRKSAKDPEFEHCQSQLDKWRTHVGKENSHDLLRRIFREGRLHDRYECASGSQVRRNLDRLFDLALSPEVAGTPTVRQLSSVIERAAKRGTEEEAVMPEELGHGRVNFMTIHGAKGLEAPVVLLVDADRHSKSRDGVLRLHPEQSSSPLLFRATNKYTDGITLKFGVQWDAKDEDEPSLEKASEIAESKNAAEAANLLYVAMTRARDRLYILGGDKERGENHTSMLRQVQQAAIAGSCESISLQDPPQMTRPPKAFEPTGEVPEFGFPTPAESSSGQSGTQSWTPPTLGTRYKIETPSTIDSVSDKPTTGATGSDDSRRLAMERGNRVHLLLQLAADAGVMPAGQGPDYDEVAAVLANPELEWVFKPELQGGRGLSEAPAIHRQAKAFSSKKMEVRITGTIDRLVIRPHCIDIIDYKTNRTGGDHTRLDDLVAHYRPQMESYAQIMGDVFKDREIRTWLLFTDPELSLKPGVAGVLKEVEIS